MGTMEGVPELVGEGEHAPNLRDLRTPPPYVDGDGSLQQESFAENPGVPRPSLREIEKGVKQELENALMSGGASAEREQRLRRIADLAAQFRTCAASTISSEQWLLGQEEPEASEGLALQVEQGLQDPPKGASSVETQAAPEVVWRPEAQSAPAAAVSAEGANDTRLRRYEAGLRRLHLIAFGMPAPPQEAPEEPDEFDTIMSDVERALNVRDTKLRELTAASEKEAERVKQLEARAASLQAQLSDAQGRGRPLHSGARRADEPRVSPPPGHTSPSMPYAGAAPWRPGGTQVDGCVRRTASLGQPRTVTVQQSTAAPVYMQTVTQSSSGFLAWPTQTTKRCTTPLSGHGGTSGSRSPGEPVALPLGSSWITGYMGASVQSSRSPTPTRSVVVPVAGGSLQMQPALAQPSMSTPGVSAMSMAQQAAAALGTMGTNPAVAATAPGVGGGAAAGWSAASQQATAAMLAQQPAHARRGQFAL